MQITTDEQAHLARLERDLQYAEAWSAKHAAQRGFDDQRWQNTDDGSQVAENWRVRVTPSTKTDKFKDVAIRTILIAFFGGSILFMLFSCLVLSL